MKLSIHLHSAVFSLSNTVLLLDSFDVTRCHSTVHNWVRKVGLQPPDGKSPSHIAVDETGIHLNDQRFWVYVVSRLSAAF